MLKLTQKSKENIEKNVGLKPEQIAEMDFSAIDSHIERKLQKKLLPDIPADKRLQGRGSVYLYLHRIIPLSWIESKLTKIAS